MFSFGSRAQGTIEYLVVIAIVVVISLVVVGIIYNASPGDGASIKSAKIRNSVGVIGFAEPVVDGQGDALIDISNNTGETMLITKISVGGVEKVFDESLAIGGNKVFSLAGLADVCGCSVVGGNRECVVVVTYTSGYGLEKIETRTVLFSCVSNATATGGVVVGLTAVCGSSATTYVWSASDFSGSFCSVGDANESSSFPVAGASVSWDCLGTDLNVTCSASHGTQAVAGLCGTANQTYASNVTTFGSDSFCSTGDENATPTFPAQGASVSWKCVGADTNANCLASRNTIPETAPVALFAKNPVSGTGTGTDLGYSIFVDSSGNMYVTGYFSSSVLGFGNDINLTGTTNGDFFVVKYNSSGVAQWAKTSESETGGDWDMAVSVFADSSGNVYVAGSFLSASLHFGNDVNLINTGVGGVADFFIVKYNSSGVAQWAKGPIGETGTTTDGVNSIFVDSSGNVYATGGFSAESISFGNDVNLDNGSGIDFFVVKYDSSGVAQWAKNAVGTGPYTEQGNSVFVDSSGNVYLTGTFYSPNLGFGNDVNLTNSNPNQPNFFVVKYDSSGVAQWAKGPSSGTGGSTETAYSVFVDASGNVYAGGYFTSTTLGFGNDINLTNMGSNDFFVVKYDSSGVAQWARGASSETGTSYEHVNSVFVDSDNNVYVAGSFASPTLGFGNDVNLIHNGADLNYDFFVVKYNSSGVAQWAKNPANKISVSNDIGQTVFVDSSSNVYLGGYFTSTTLGFGNDVNLTNRGSGDFFLVKYGLNGS